MSRKNIGHGYRVMRKDVFQRRKKKMEEKNVHEEKKKEVCIIEGGIL